MQTLVMVPAMIGVLRPVALTAATNSGLSQALISPRRDVLRVGRVVVDLWNQWAVRALRHQAVVMTGILLSVAMLARAAARARSSGMGMSPTVWNRPLWWSMSSMAASSGSITGAGR